MPIIVGMVGSNLSKLSCKSNLANSALVELYLLTAGRGLLTFFLMRTTMLSCAVSSVFSADTSRKVSEGSETDSGVQILPFE